MLPGAIVWAGFKEFKVCESVEKAKEWVKEYGMGDIYVPHVEKVPILVQGKQEAISTSDCPKLVRLPDGNAIDADYVVAVIAFPETPSLISGIKDIDARLLVRLTDSYTLVVTFTDFPSAIVARDILIAEINSIREGVKNG